MPVSTTNWCLQLLQLIWSLAHSTTMWTHRRNHCSEHSQDSNNSLTVVRHRHGSNIHLTLQFGKNRPKCSSLAIWVMNNLTENHLFSKLRLLRASKRRCNIKLNRIAVMRLTAIYLRNNLRTKILGRITRKRIFALNWTTTQSRLSGKTKANYLMLLAIGCKLSSSTMCHLMFHRCSKTRSTKIAK